MTSSCAGVVAAVLIGCWLIDRTLSIHQADQAQAAGVTM
jgi:hypothetical protein